MLVQRQEPESCLFMNKTKTTCVYDLRVLLPETKKGLALAFCAQLHIPTNRGNIHNQSPLLCYNLIINSAAGLDQVYAASSLKPLVWVYVAWRVGPEVTLVSAWLDWWWVCCGELRGFRPQVCGRSIGSWLERRMALHMSIVGLDCETQLCRVIHIHTACL